MMLCIYSSLAGHLLCYLQLRSDVPTVNRVCVSCSPPSYTDAGCIWTSNTWQTVSSLATIGHCAEVLLLTVPLAYFTGSGQCLPQNFLHFRHQTHIHMRGLQQGLSCSDHSLHLWVHATISISKIHQNYLQILRECCPHSFTLKDRSQAQFKEELHRMRFVRIQMQSIHVLRTSHLPNTSICITNQDS